MTIEERKQYALAVRELPNGRIAEVVPLNLRTVHPDFVSEISPPPPPVVTPIAPVASPPRARIALVNEYDPYLYVDRSGQGEPDGWEASP